MASNAPDRSLQPSQQQDRIVGVHRLIGFSHSFCNSLEIPPFSATHLQTKADKSTSNSLNSSIFEGLVSLCAPDAVCCSRHIEYSRAVTPQIRQAGNRLSGLTETAYASLLA